jgi:hypothetical protein
MFSSLPTTIFSVMSALAAQHQSVNLGQGFPGAQPWQGAQLRVRWQALHLAPASRRLTAALRRCRRRGAGQHEGRGGQQHAGVPQPGERAQAGGRGAEGQRGRGAEGQLRAAGPASPAAAAPRPGLLRRGPEKAPGTSSGRLVCGAGVPPARTGCCPPSHTHITTTV